MVSGVEWEIACAKMHPMVGWTLCGRDLFAPAISRRGKLPVFWKECVWHVSCRYNLSLWQEQTQRLSESRRPATGVMARESQSTKTVQVFHAPAEGVLNEPLKLPDIIKKLKRLT